LNLALSFSPFRPADSHTIADRLRYWAEHLPSAVAFYSSDGEGEDRQLTYAELDRQARAVAAAAQANGIVQGDRVLLLYPPGLEFVAGFFGCLYAGAIAVPAYPPRRNRNLDRIQAISRDAQAAMVLTVDDTLRRVRDSLHDIPPLEKLVWMATDRTPIAQAGDWTDPGITHDSTAVLQYTSGSTGLPKGVVLSHANLMHNCKLITYAFELSRDGSGLTWLPTYHDMGLVGGVLNPVFFGRPNVLMSPMAFLQKPVRWLRGITKYRSTISGGPNFAYELCNTKITAAECHGLDLSSWDVAFNGAEPIRAETLESFTRKFAPYGFRAETHYPCYGMAETTLIVAGGRKIDRPVIRTVDRTALENNQVVPDQNGDWLVRKVVGCGRPLPEHQFRIVDVETLTALPDNRVGEIWVSGPCVGQGYWKKPKATRHAFAARLKGDDERRYLRTGDLGFFADGELFVTGRSKDLIIFCGRNLHPHDIEMTVERAHVGLRMSGGATFAIDQDDGEGLVVVQEVERGHRRGELDEMMEAIREAVTSEFEVPVSAVLLLDAGRLPKTSSGKVQRHACRAHYLAGQLPSIAEWQLQTPPPAGAASKTTSVSPRHDATVTSEGAQAICDWLAAQIGQRSGRSAAQIDIHQPFVSFGLDSVALVGISGELEDWLGKKVSPTLLYGYPTIAALAEHLSADPAAAGDTSGVSKRATENELIAVVGLGCRFPGADSPAAFWKLLRDGADAIGEVPSDRWDADAWYDARSDMPGKLVTRQGGFLTGVDQFDAPFFHLSAREAETLDPQQRLLLEVAWATLENAAQSPDRLVDTDTGVFVGISGSDYARLQGRAGDFNTIDAHTGTGTLNSVAAGRLAYVLGLHGPCLAVDTACSSSLASVHLAIASLRSRECRAALAGGVNLILDPSTSVALSAMHALSPDGRCHTFDAAAGGYGRGEGCGMVMLKRLADAVDDGDRILAVIRGSAMNHDGRSNGLTAPHGPSQANLIRSALADAGIEPEQVSYVEAHGTGTELGDPIEVQVLDEVYCPARSEERPLSIGSVKTNIGHLEPAAGIASLLKTVLMLNHGQIAPHLHFNQPNPYIPWDQLPIEVPTRLVDWPSQHGRRIAGVSSFGFSGTNVHLILEEAPQPAAAEVEIERPRHLLVLSGQNEASLRDNARQFAEFINQHPDDVADVCFTAAAGRAHLLHRLAVTGTDAAEIAQRLVDFGQPKASAGAYHAAVDEQRRPRIAFLFTGQGSEFVGMARELYQTQPTFRALLDRCDEILRGQLELPLLAVLYELDEAASPLGQTAYAQPALFAMEYALARLWQSWGVVPDVLLGHSVGEYVAACLAGVFSLEDGLRLIAARGRLMQAQAAEGAMVAVAADEQTVRQAIQPHGDKVSIAAVNGPHQTVISGQVDAVREAVAVFDRHGLRTTRLDVSHAFHSALMEPMLDEFEQVCRSIEMHAPVRPLVSSVDGRLQDEELTSPAYWRSQVRGTVRFADGVAELERQGADVFLEIGPRPILVTAASQCIDAAGKAWLGSLRRPGEDWRQMLDVLAELYTRGVEIDWQGFDADYARRKLDAPTYPFQRKRYWLDTVTAATRPGSARSAPAASLSSDAPPEDSYFELQWRPKSLLGQWLPRRPADFLPAPDKLAELVAPEIRRVQSQLRLPRYRDLERDLNRLAAAYARRALCQLGWRPGEVDSQDLDSLGERLRVVPRHRQLLARLIEMVRESGISSGGNGKPAKQVHADPDALAAAFAENYPECAAELALLRQCGDHLAEVLRGDTDPLSVLFPGGSAELVESLYRDSPIARPMNALVEETILRPLDALPVNRPIRILEIGAGTGGTTAQILPGLPPERTEYVFTDISELFTQAAAEKFRDFPFVRYATLDIERDPGEQGFAAGQFDVILAANVVHATRGLRDCLAHVRSLLTPHGMLVLLEGTRPQGLLDLSFGLTTGWWRFADRGLRPNYPLLSTESWTKLLLECGFASARALPTPDPDEPHVSAPQAVIIAQASEIPCEMAGAPAILVRQSLNIGRWLIFADQSGVGARLADAVRSRGEPVTVVSRGERFAQVDENQFEIGAGSRDDVRRVLEAIQPGDPAAQRRVVFLWALDSGDADQLTVDSLQDAQKLGSESALSVIQEIARAHPAGGARCWLVTRGVHATPDTKAVTGLAQSPLWGLGRVLSEEHPALWGGLIDLQSGGEAGDSALRLLDEIEQADGEDQVALREDSRFAARLVRRVNNSPTSPLKWRADASYLISGGLGDLGLQVAQWMVRQGARTLILLGRSEFPPRDQWDAATAEDPGLAAKINVLRQLDAAGARIKIAAVDVADPDCVESMFDALEAEGWPPVRGVVHAAGVAEACPLLELETSQLREVMKSKVAGAWLLDRLTAGDRLDFFVSFSSGAALLGSPMLGSYAAANAFLDSLARHRRAAGRPALSINWGFWDEVGMAARSQREIGRGFAPQGMRSFSPSQGLAALEDLLRQGATQTAVMPVDWDEWGQFHARAARAPLLSQLLRAPENAHSEGVVAEGQDALSREAALAAAPQERLKLLTDYLTRQLARVLRTPVEELDVQTPLNHLGIDSLMAVELRNRVQNQLGVAIPVAKLLEEPSIAQLAELLAQLFEESGAGAATQRATTSTPTATSDQTHSRVDPPAQVSTAGEALARLDQLSDEEVEEMLQKLQD